MSLPSRRLLLGAASALALPAMARAQAAQNTAVFELKGSANKPALRYLPTESLMTGVKGTAQLAFDILVNAITLPQKAFSMVEESIAGSEDEDFLTGGRRALRERGRRESRDRF